GMDVARCLRHEGLIGSRNKVHAGYSSEALEVPLPFKGVTSFRVFQRGVHPNIAHAELSTMSKLLGVRFLGEGSVDESRVSAVGFEMPYGCLRRSHLTRYRQNS